MSIISRYILLQTMTPLLAAVAIALMILLTERMLRLLDLVLGSTGGLAVLVEMLAYLVPHYIALALPAAFFLGVLLAFNRLHREHELDALGSAGIGLFRLLRPVLALAVLLAILSALNFGIGQPYARYIYRALVHSVGDETVNAYMRARTFMTVDGVTFMSERLGRDRRTFGQVFIFDDAAEDGSLALTARSGVLAKSADGERTVVLLNDGVGVDLDESAQPMESDAAPDYGVVRFDRLIRPIDIADPSEFRDRGEDERELTIVELWSSWSSPPPDVTPDQMLAELHDRLVRSLSVLFLPFLAVAFAFGNRRSQRVFGVATGLLILVTYNQALTIGKSLVSIGNVTALVGQWGPCVLLALASAYFFYRATRIPSGGTLVPTISFGGLKPGVETGGPHEPGVVRE